MNAQAMLMIKGYMVQDSVNKSGGKTLEKKIKKRTIPAKKNKEGNIIKEEYEEEYSESVEVAIPEIHYRIPTFKEAINFDKEGKELFNQYQKDQRVIRYKENELLKYEDEVAWMSFC